MEYFILFTIWLTFGIATGIIAYSKGRSTFGFMMLSIFFSPVIGMTAAVVARPDDAVLENRFYSTMKVKRCEGCHELVRIEAKICKYCHAAEFVKRL